MAKKFVYVEIKKNLYTKQHSIATVSGSLKNNADCYYYARWY